jgi:hypothetical protein
MDRYDQLAKQASDVHMAWRPHVIARLTDQVRAVFPDAVLIRFEIEEFDNGPFLTIKSIVTERGELDENLDSPVDADAVGQLRHDTAEVMADLTTVMGPDLDELQLESREQRRRRIAGDLLEQHTNSFDGSDELDDLITHRWALVMKRDTDAWVVGIDTPREIANHEISESDSLDVEWVEGVYDLESGEPVYYSAHTTVTVTMADGSGTAVVTR